MSDIDFKKLVEPFEESDLEWRIQQSGISNGKPWGMAVAYITNRAIQIRLDDVVGQGKWRNEYIPDNDGYLCGLSLKIDDEWVAKWDGAEKTEIEPMKGGLSGAMKRAAVQWGIGRYLYNLDVVFVICNEVTSRRDATDNFAHFKDKYSGQKMMVNWEAPGVPMWALPGAKEKDYANGIVDATDMKNLKSAYQDAYRYAKSFGRDDLVEKFTKSKDTVKACIDGAAKAEVGANYLVVSEWLDSQISSLHLIPNESSVKQVHGAFKAQLADKCEGQYFDAEELSTRLSTAIAKRIKEIGEQE